MKQHQLMSIILLVIVLGLLAGCNTSATTTPAEKSTDVVKPSETPSQPAATPTRSEPVTVRWFIGLGPGSDIDAFQALQVVVDEFNASQDEIELVLEINGGATAYDYLATAISGGRAPDLVGPVGIRGRDGFKGDWLDLQPLIEASGYDMSDYDPVMVEFFRDRDEGQLGIPLQIYPSFIVVNKDLFDKAGLPYPPQEYGASYIDENGEKKPWNTDTLRELAMKLTLDASGNDAASPHFNSSNIVQFGYLEQYADMRGALTLFGPGSLVSENGKAAHMPRHWRAGAKWIYDAMWTDHFWPADAAIKSELLGNDSAFQSGKLAMAHVHLWFAAPWALDPDKIDFTWDTAVVPAYNGRVTAKMHADAFYIPKRARHPEEAFKVLAYLLSDDIAPKLIEIYSGGNAMPARVSLQDRALKAYSDKVFPGQNINWQVVLDSIQYADHPNHESWMPGYSNSLLAYEDTWKRFTQEPGLDVDAEDRKSVV